MRKKWMAVAALAAVAMAGCGGDSGTNVTPKDELVGTWLSTGTNVAIGLRSTLKVKQIVATFNENNTYNVVSTDSSNVNTTFTGTWSAGAVANSGAIRAITLNQSVPSALVSTGIFQVTGTTLKYEVIQTSPAIQGFTAPTVTGGFGSTAYNGVPLGATWTQIFVKQ